MCLREERRGVLPKNLMWKWPDFYAGSLPAFIAFHLSETFKRQEVVEEHENSQQETPGSLEQAEHMPVTSEVGLEEPSHWWYVGSIEPSKDMIRKAKTESDTSGRHESWYIPGSQVAMVAARLPCGKIWDKM